MQSTASEADVSDVFGVVQAESAIMISTVDVKQKQMMSALGFDKGEGAGGVKKRWAGRI